MLFSKRKLMSINLKNKLTVLNGKLKNKAIQSRSNYYIAAAAYTRVGNLLSIACNNVNTKQKSTKKGMGIHAERKLIARHGRKIKYIVLSRTNNSGGDLPIHPCENCAKMIDKYGIKIILMHELLSTLHEE